MYFDGDFFVTLIFKAVIKEFNCTYNMHTKMIMIFICVMKEVVYKIVKDTINKIM